MNGRRTVLLTGASAGLGLAIARRLIAEDFNVVLTARASSIGRFAIEGINANERIMIEALDVTSDAQRRAVVERVDRRFGGVDVLINNAGVAYRSVTEHVCEADRLAQMDVNFFSPMELSRLVLPQMRARRTGHVINVSSVSGMMAMPTMGVYSASKFALEGATEALYYEVKPWNVHVSLVQPGFIHSRSFENVRFTRMSDWSVHHDEDAYHPHYEHMSPFIAKMMERSRATPDAVAKKIIGLIKSKRPALRVAGTLDASLFGLLRRLLPRSIYHWLLYRSLPRVQLWGVPTAAQVVLPTVRSPRRLPLPPPPVGAGPSRMRAPRGTDSDGVLGPLRNDYDLVEDSDAIFDSVDFSIASRTDARRRRKDGDDGAAKAPAPPPGVDS